eukprot:4510186-Prorocentrum_lima.AAC.1
MSVTTPRSKDLRIRKSSSGSSVTCWFGSNVLQPGCPSPQDTRSLLLEDQQIAGNAQSSSM